METLPSTPSAERLFSLRIRSGREVRRVTAHVGQIAAEVRSLCEELGVDEQALERICLSVRQALSRVASLAPGEKIVFCDCDAQFSGNCRPPDRVSENPCNVDTPMLERAPHSPGKYFFPAGALTGADGSRTPGTPLKLCGQRVEIAVADPVPTGVVPRGVSSVEDAADSWAATA
ncbi:MAG: hypothetical protein PHI23_03230 [Candidatus Peribacteraceae bacterium]|nr:hypothetical protein [Candidatus Peribacteraceae bacterium]